jgi:hypothetical protein
MMTYLTRPKYGMALADLDNARLFQAMEDCMDIFDVLTGVKPQPSQHPVYGMWRGYEYALGIYAMMGNLEWTFKRGYADHTYVKFFNTAIKEMRGEDPEFAYEPPPWFRDSDVILSHRSALVRLDKAEYGSKWKQCPANWPTLWPQIDENREDGYGLWLSKSDKELVKSKKLTRPPAETLQRVINWP